MKKVTVFACLLLYMMNGAEAQKLWTLEECINYALENNIQLKREQLNVQYNKNNYSQSFFSTLPNLNAGVNHGYYSLKEQQVVEGRVVTNDAWNGQAYLSSSLVLFNGFQTLNDIRQKKYLFLQSQSNLKKRQNDVSLELANGYLQVLFSKELYDVAKNKLEVTSLQTERTKKLLDVGNVAQGEYLQIKAQEANDKTSVINAKNNLDIATLDLTQLLDLDSVGDFDIVVPQNIEVEILAPLESVQTIYEEALKNMPQIKSAEYALRSSEKQLKKSWGLLSPNVSVNGSVNSSYSNTKIPATGGVLLDPDPYFVQLGDKQNRNFSININIPIFNQLQVRNSISNSRLQVNDYQLQLDQARMDLYKEVQQAHADATAAREKYYSSVESVNYNQESFKYTSQKMEVGLVNSVDYNIAQNLLISAQSNMLQAKYEYIFKLKILDLYMGKQITL